MNLNVLPYFFFCVECKQRQLLLVLITLSVTKARAEHAGSN